MTNEIQSFVFCSQCGKRIKVDSKFCRFCGVELGQYEDLNVKKNIDAKTPTLNEHFIKSIQNNNSQEQTLSLYLNTDRKIKRATIANEIIANIKMIGLALILSICYIIGFIVYHTNDRAPLTDSSSYFGESCYDGIITGHWEFSWEKHLINKIHNIKTKNDKNSIREFIQTTSINSSNPSSTIPERNLEYAQRLAKVKNINNEEFELLKQEALEDAKKDRDLFNEQVSEIRKMKYEEELHENMFWSIIIALIVTIVGRYLIISIKWVKENKTE